MGESVADEEGLFLKYQADRCRWLASQSSEPKIMAKLQNMARDYEAKAAALENERHSLPMDEPDGPPTDGATGRTTTG
jgi:hypothetical protein